MTVDTQQLNEIRRKLLDLSQKNRLLNYRESSARSVKIINRSLEDVYTSLVLDEKNLTFYPVNTEEVLDEDKNKWKYPDFSKTEKNADTVLDTPYTGVELRKHLHTLQNKARTILDEQGYSILYLSLGFIQWHESENKVIKAPFILLPVELHHQKLKESYILRWSGEEPVVSQSLIEKCKECSIELPEFDALAAQHDLTSYLGSITSLFESTSWKFIPEIVLDLFSFKKLIMFKDLDPENWIPKSTEIETDEYGVSVSVSSIDADTGLGGNSKQEDIDVSEDIGVQYPLLRSIFSPQINAPSEPMQSISNVDTWLSSRDSYTILDADSSQLEVIEAAKKGMNLVVEGPPGTGKSQTIANLIAELLVIGKSVLFVSEKMAALDVVKRRLDNAGLSRFCLELHSQKARKRELLKELESSIHAPTLLREVNEKDIAYIDEVKKHLNNYCYSISTPIGKSGYTVYDLIGLHEKYVSMLEVENPVILQFDDVMSISYEEHKDAVTSLRELSLNLEKIIDGGSTLKDYPWTKTSPKLILPNEQRVILGLLTEYIDSFEKVNNAIQEVNTAICNANNVVSGSESIPQETSGGISIIEPTNEEVLSIYCELVWCLKDGVRLELSILESPLWENKTLINDFLTEIESLFMQYKEIHTHFTDAIFNESPASIQSTLKSYVDKTQMWKDITAEYKRFKDKIAQFSLHDISDDGMLLQNINYVIDYLSSYKEFKTRRANVLELFKPVCTENTIPEPSELQKYCDLIFDIRGQVKIGKLDYQSVVSTTVANIDDALASSLYDTLVESAEILKNAKNTLDNHLKIDKDVLSLPFKDFEEYVQKWSGAISTLGNWSRFLSHVDLCTETPAKVLLPFILNGEIAPKDIVPIYITNYADALLGEAYREYTSLATFSQRVHEQRITEFIESDKKLIAENPARVCSILEKRIPNIECGNTGNEEVNVLLGEFSRKTGHMSIRTLMTKAGKLIQKIKPCFMMSPLSVAQYLDLSTVRFDVIIFDEASQVKPEDALGSIMRGSQLIVMGDSNQLPPTSFFDLITDTEDETEVVAGIGDMESLLHLCKKVYPIKRLKWHYRSRHESLIALPNQEFYDGNMLVFPSPKHTTEDLGLSFVYLEDAVYGRGDTGVNRIEAKAVAEAAISHYKKYPRKSLGIATFSTRQQEAIREEVEILLQNEPEIELLMYPEKGEQFFVKNLETIQGDERDTILISIGYGRDKNGKLTRSFGPLNIDGGGRRLNVLITRARERCVVFANFRGVDLHADEHSSAGIRALADFLTYAETRRLVANTKSSITIKEEDYFVNVISDILKEQGYTVDEKVGCANFRVDLAIRNSENPGEYMAGIVCDGENYSSSKITRDRERLRLQTLHNLGWNIIHVWSAEWYLNPTDCKQALLDSLKQINEQESTSF